MTREDAIANLNMISVAFVEPVTKEQRKLIEDTFEMAIKALEQEPCEDAVSRKWLKTAIHNFYYGLKHTPTEDDIQAYINAAPPVNPQKQKTGWIPVSERLPEESGRYLAYIVNEHAVELQYIMTCDYSVDGYWHWFPDDECASDNVIAWMPLPKPYEPQEWSE